MCFEATKLRNEKRNRGSISGCIFKNFVSLFGSKNTRFHTYESCCCRLTLQARGRVLDEDKNSDTNNAYPRIFILKKKETFVSYLRGSLGYWKVLTKKKKTQEQKLFVVSTIKSTQSAAVTLFNI